MKNTLLAMPFNDGKRFYIGQFVKTQFLFAGPAAPGEPPLEMTGHVVRCQQDGAQTIIEIEHDG